MNIPKKIKISFKEYDVREKSELRDEKGRELYGRIEYLPEVIFLNAENSEGQKKATLMHEIVHGLDDIYGIDLKEKQVRKLGIALYMMICDNPDMFGGEKT